MKAEIEITPPPAGTDIEDAFAEAIRIAKILDVRVRFNFNGIFCSADKESTPKIGALRYRNTIKAGSSFACA